MPGPSGDLRTRGPVLPVLALAGSLMALNPGAPASAASWSLSQTFNNPSPAVSDRFGESVAISGGNVLIGAYGDNTGAVDAGSAYLFNAATGGLLRTFNNPTPATNDNFGFSVAISGGNVLIGAPSDASDVGRAYLFDAATGGLLRTFNNPFPTASDFFGRSVAISGSNVLIGAYGDDTSAADAGSAYLFDAVTGGLLRTFNNPFPTASDFFGWSVAISGDNVLIGALLDDTGSSDTGSAYLFDAATGGLLRTFNNPSPDASDNFGASLAISGGNVLIAAAADNTGATNAGSAYLFDAATGDLLHSFTNPSPATNDFFGASVAIGGGSVLIGASGDDTGAIGAGSAYLYDAATGDLLQTLNNPSPEDADFFGRSVAISGSNVLIGAYGEDTGAADAGSAYLFTRDAEAQAVPGPLPLLGLGAAFAWSRRLRSRMGAAARRES